MLRLAAIDYVEMITLLISIFCYRKTKGTALGLFPFFLLFIVVAEAAGFYIAKVLHRPNAWLYNITTVAEFCFYSFFFSRIFKTNRSRQAALAVLCIYPAAAFCNILFIQGFNSFHSYTMVLGSLCMIFFCCTYYYQSLSNPEKKQIHADPLFWIVTGIFFFYLGDIFYNTLYNILVKYNIDTGKRLFLAINNNLIFVLYACFAAGFILWKKNTQKLQ